MRILLLLLALLAVVAWWSLPAQAYNGETGNRAPDIAGWDVVGQRSVHLSDYLGRWVILEFCAMWCGPCQKELPEFIKNVKPYVESGELAVIMVSCDSPETLPKLKKMIREKHINFPVIYDGGDFDSVPVMDWCKGDTIGFGIPKICLINPQGVVVSEDLHADVLPATLKFFVSGNKPVIGLRSWQAKNEDGTYTFHIELMDPTRTPVVARITFDWEEWKCDPDDPARAVTDIDRHNEYDFAKPTLTYDEFGEASYEVTVTPTPKQDIIGFSVWLTYPGSDTAPGLEGRGVSLTTGLSQAFLIGIEDKDGQWRVLPD